MWFDTVIIDKVNIDSKLQTTHIRSKYDKLPTEKLEEIDCEAFTDNTFDVGPLRVHAADEMNISQLNSKIKNLSINEDRTELYVQLDHFGIPVTAGYYSCIFPKGWRLVEVNVYDPYSNQDNPAKNRSYRDVVYSWDPVSEFSSVQFEMLSNRGTFALGIIAKLAPAGELHDFIEEESRLSIRFSDERHKNHPMEKAYQEASDAVIDNKTQKEKEEIPPVNLSMIGPTVDIIAWGKYIAKKIRRPKK
ncbi:hypothetical protein [Alteromonas macleodii]|uniref:hypothetical protein n=1 Tax=Alteromonas macleodii TaxID=28108 RepID=UPI0031406EC1